MDYQITRNELLDMIDKEPLPAVKQILFNHLHIMDGQYTICKSCSFDEEDDLSLEEEDD